MIDIETTVMRKVAWRLVPYLCIGYVINALDRYNVSIAALTMNKDLGLAMDAVASTGSTAPLGSHAAEIYAEFIASDASHADKDFSAVIEMFM